MAIELLVTAADAAADIVRGVLVKYDATEWGGVGDINLYQFPMNAGGVGLKRIDRQQVRLYIWQVIKPGTMVSGLGMVNNYAGRLCRALADVPQIGYTVEHEVRAGLEKCQLCEVGIWNKDRWRELWEYEKYPDGWLLEKTPDGEYVASTRHREAFRSALMTVPDWAIMPVAVVVEAQIVETTAGVLPARKRGGGRRGIEKLPGYQDFLGFYPKLNSGELSRKEVVSQLEKLGYPFTLEKLDNWLRIYRSRNKGEPVSD